MSRSDVSERGLETALVAGMRAHGWIDGDRRDFDTDRAVDLAQLAEFLTASQPDTAAELTLDQDTPARRRFLDRLSAEIDARGIVDVLRNGVKHQRHHVTLMHPTPSRGNSSAQQRFDLNRFSVVRQLHYSPTRPTLSLDVCLMLNGLPVATMELKNTLTGQTFDDAIEQYKRDRDPRDPLLRPGRTLVHLAVDDTRAAFCTRLAGQESWFLPFNKGHNGGAGNPPNPNGLMTSYLWEDILTPTSLVDIVENYAARIEPDKASSKATPKPGKAPARREQIWPRYHQLDVARRIVASVQEDGVGQRYLIQHSAGSGKSNSIAWLVHKLTRQERRSTDGIDVPMFDSVIVVTDRRLLDRQIRSTIRQFSQVSSTIGHARSAGELRELIDAGKKIIITTIQKFPHILDALDADRAGKTFAVVIDEAHSSQSGRAAAALSRTLQAAPTDPATTGDGAHGPAEAAPGAAEPTGRALDDEDDEATGEDLINAAMAGRKLAANASYFAFTATPKNKTLEMFGTAYVADGVVKHRPFHVYSMRQAIEEGFILDVLAAYTSVDSYYRITKTATEDPEFDVKRANKRLRHYVEGHDHAISVKADIMVDHLLDQVIGQGKIAGQARTMVVCGSIRRAIQYYQALNRALAARGSRHRAIVAFSGEHDLGGKKVSEASLNGFPSAEIPEKIQQDPYRILVCADKFQTGYDEPLMHTMYVDKMLDGVKAVQTLSRLNRAHPDKRDVCVIDFQNDTEAIRESFEPFYQTTILADETDVNKLHDLKSDLDAAQVHTADEASQVAGKFLAGAERSELDAVLDRCAARYVADLDASAQARFKGGAKAFVRTYDFLGAIISFDNADWERLALFLGLLVPKLPAPTGDQAEQGLVAGVRLESYRAEKRAVAALGLAPADGEIDPVPTGSMGGERDVEKELLSRIVRSFNDQFGNVAWTDRDRVIRVITADLPDRVAASEAYQNALIYSDEENARVELAKALGEAILDLMKDDAEMFKRYSQDPVFRAWLLDTIFEHTSGRRTADAA
jgi:type I restriction enzyme R subunit